MLRVDRGMSQTALAERIGVALQQLQKYERDTSRIGAAKLSRKIIEMPIRYRQRVYGETNIRRWSHGWLLLQMSAFAARRMKWV